MPTVLAPDVLARALSDLDGADAPRTPETRQPVHTVYGGAHLFRHDTAEKLGRLALATLDRYAPDAMMLGHALGTPGHEHLPTQPGDASVLESAVLRDGEAMRCANHAAWLAVTLRQRVLEKLRREPVEDYRIDFEDGYGTRTDAEEDAHAESAAREVVKGLAEGTLPPFVGIRVKSLAPETRARAVRTLDLFVGVLAREGGGRLPPWFAVTLPKVSRPAEIAALATLLDALEAALGVERGSIHVEAMIETPRSLVGEDGRLALSELVRAARGRCRSVHLGAYDLAASLDVVAPRDALRHPACDVARVLMKLAVAGMGVEVCDGATTELPVGVHTGAAPSDREREENRSAVFRGWRRAFGDVTHALSLGIYQGWDLHPAQLVSRYAAVYAFFLDGLDGAGDRLASFVAQAARARSRGASFDDAATGQALLAFFVRAVSAGAITEADAAVRTGLSLAELRGRSFAAIVAARALPEQALSRAAPPDRSSRRGARARRR